MESLEIMVGGRLLIVYVLLYLYRLNDRQHLCYLELLLRSFPFLRAESHLQSTY